MADNVRLYLDAHKRYETAVSKVSDLIGIGSFSNPLNFMFSNTERGMPSEVAVSKQSNSVDGKLWPSAADIQITLADLHQASGHFLERGQRLMLMIGRG